MTTTHTLTDSFLTLLAAAGRSPEIEAAMDVYGWLVGSWQLDVLHYKGEDVSSQNLQGEAHFAWVLEGRAIQDLWIMPRVRDRKPDSDRVNNMYGATLRIWDPALRAWRIRWFNPVSGHEERQTGRRVGHEIVQVGARPDGTATRWRFTEITNDSFHWLGEALEADGKSWKLEGEFRAHRMQL
ncbi:MAG TPA: hypothetical protein VFW31_16210 [Candidatus Angelobacter sp.]|nr:hypothetical protein [Candidatus Angelobacter sp.]